jgi:hypothetical protein
MWFKKNKKEETEKKPTVKDDSMSKIIDEVLNEQAAQKEAAIKEAAQRTEPTPAQSEARPAPEINNQHITELIDKFYENQNNDSFKNVIDAILPATLLVPMVPVPGDENSDKKQFRPGLITNQKNEKFFPAFTERSQVPDDYASKFTLVAVPFAACCDLTTKVPECEKLLVNPFTKQFIINANLAGAVVKASQQQSQKRKGMIEFTTPEPETESLVKTVVKRFEDVPEIQKAYFSKMKNQDQISYVFIIDCPADKCQELFPQIIDYIKSEKIEQPVTLMLYEQLKKVADESKHITQVYSK